MLEDYLVHESQPILEAAGVIQAAAVRCCVVVNDAKRIVGVFSEGDVLRALLRGTDMHIPLRQVLSGRFLYLHEFDYRAAFVLFREKGVTLIPIVDQNFVVQGIITIFDILKRVEFRAD